MHNDYHHSRDFVFLGVAALACVFATCGNSDVKEQEEIKPATAHRPSAPASGAAVAKPHVVSFQKQTSVIITVPPPSDVPMPPICPTVQGITEELQKLLQKGAFTLDDLKKFVYLKQSLVGQNAPDLGQCPKVTYQRDLLLASKTGEDQVWQVATTVGRAWDKANQTGENIIPARHSIDGLLAAARVIDLLRDPSDTDGSPSLPDRIADYLGLSRDIHAPSL